MLLVTGSNGQLGTELKSVLADAVFAGVNDLDITDFQAVQDFVSKNKITTIINCAAYTVVDKAEEDADTCLKINVLGCKNLALSGAKIIHISTDYVFDGTHYRPYSETDLPKPLGVYGQTKREGEFEVMRHAKSYLIIRTSWLYSCYGNNFVKTMRRLGEQKESLGVVCDQIGTPTYAGDLAQAIADILPKITPDMQEILHYSNEGVASWYDFAREVMKLSGLKCRIDPLESKDYPTKAKRPFYSVLNKTKIKNMFGITIPHWQESLEKCLKKF